jgi:hypothetical protein
LRQIGPSLLRIFVLGTRMQTMNVIFLARIFRDPPRKFTHF